MCEWSSRALRSILAHAATAPMKRTSWEASKSVGGETKSTRGSTTTTCRPKKCDSAARLSMSMSMCRGRAHHTYLQVPVPNLPTLPFSISHPTIAKLGRRSSPCTSVCLSVYQACFHSRAVCLPSQLCVQCCPAASARTPVWHLPAELGVVAGSARRPAGWQA